MPKPIIRPGDIININEAIALKRPFNRFAMLDVESRGLHGEGFAYGLVLFIDGKEVEFSANACDPLYVDGFHHDLEWVAKNVTAPRTCESSHMVRERFWNTWMYLRGHGFCLVADCSWPVETNFLSLCLRRYEAERKSEQPYPLYDVSSVLASLGYDPVGNYGRLENEKPEHDPVCDARQSGRVLVRALTGTLERRTKL